MEFSQFNPWSSLSSSRPKVLIFGTGAAGQLQSRKIRNSHDVIGFVDNNASKHGSVFEKKTIYPPQDIPKLVYDKIIIASGYYQEINQQLIHDLKITPEKISVFHDGGQQAPSIWSTIVQFFSQRYFRTMLNSNKLIAELGLFLVRRFDRSYQSVNLTPVQWQDTQLKQIEATLLPERSIDITGPKFIGNSRLSKTVTSPAICLSGYRSATITCASNSLLFDNKLLMWRSPTSDNNHSDYSAGFIVNHGQRQALTKDFDTVDIEKGIAITGSNDVNYYHWMLEVIAKLAFIDQLDKRYKDYPILISAKAREIEAISSFINQLALERQFVYLRSNQCYKVDDLLTITPPNFVVPNFKGKTRFNIEDCYFTPESLQFLRATALAHMADQSIQIAPCKRIFLARKGVFRAYNQDEVWELLQPMGFDKVYLEDMSFAEQVFLMQHVEIIIGPSGAAWTNLLFCQPDTKALCWMAGEAGEFSCFSHLAAEMQVEMDCFLYKAGASNSRELYFGTYNVDVDKILQWLVGQGTVEQREKHQSDTIH